MREIRKLTESGHQAAILSTDQRSDLGPEAAMAQVLRDTNVAIPTSAPLYREPSMIPRQT